MRPISKIVLAMSALVMASLACSTLNRGANPTAVPDQPQEATLAESSTEETTADDQTGTNEDGESIDIPDVEGDLSNLSSYTLIFTMSVNGKNDAGEEKSGSFEILEEINVPQIASHTRWTGTGEMSSDTAGSSSFEMYNIDNVSYLLDLSGDTPSCSSFSSGESVPFGMSSYSPEDWFGAIDKAKLVSKGEEVNGVITDHYKFDQSNVVFGGYQAASGEIWVAQDGGYTVKMSATATGDSLWSDDVKNAQITWEYNLSQINQDVQIVLPDVCAEAGPADDIPVPDSATDTSIFGTMTTFSTADSSATVADFYRAELPNQGWEITSDEEFSGMYTISATKDDRSLSVLITAGDSTTSVIITEE